MCWEDNLDLLEATLEPIGVIYLYSGVFLGAWLMLGPFRLIFNNLGYFWPSRGCLGAVLGYLGLSWAMLSFLGTKSVLQTPCQNYCAPCRKNKHSGTPSSRGGFRLSNKNILLGLALP